MVWHTTNKFGKPYSIQVGESKRIAYGSYCLTFLAYSGKRIVRLPKPYASVCQTGQVVRQTDAYGPLFAQTDHPFAEGLEGGVTCLPNGSSVWQKVAPLWLTCLLKLFLCLANG